MTRKEATRIVRASGGNICIRYIKNPVTQRPLFIEQLFHITRRSPGLAAGFMTASLSLSTLSYAQEGPAPKSVPLTIQTDQKIEQNDVESDVKSDAKADLKSLTRVSGTVLDAAGAVVPGTAVKLTNEKTEFSDKTVSIEDGTFRFDLVKSGDYRIEAFAPGFRKSIMNVSVTGQNETVADIRLNVALNVSVAGGGFAVEYGSELNRAVADQDIERVKELISKGENVNGKDSNYDGITPLFLAVEQGNLEIAQTLLNYGAKVNARDKSKQTPMMMLDDDAAPELVEALIGAGATVNVKDNEGDTPLILAARSVKADVLKALIDSGAEVNAANNGGKTALMSAVESGDIEKVRLLILAGAEVNARDKEGETAWEKTSEDAIEELLVSFGAIANDEHANAIQTDKPDNK